MRGLGTLLNVGTVALGTTVGVLFGNRVPDRFGITVMQGLGLIVVGLGFAAPAFATTFGWGVGASIITIVVVQGSITAAVALLDPVLTTRMVDEMSAVGGVMLVGIGLRLLDIHMGADGSASSTVGSASRAAKQIRVASFLPGLVLAPVLVAVFAR